MLLRGFLLVEGRGVTCDVQGWIKISPRLAQGRLYVLSNPAPRWLLMNDRVQAQCVSWSLEHGFLRKEAAWAVILSDGSPIQATLSSSRREAEEIRRKSGFDPATESVDRVEHLFFGPAGEAYWRQHFGKLGTEGIEPDLAPLFYGEAHGYDGVWWDERTRLQGEGFGRAPRGAIFQDRVKAWRAQDMGPLRLLDAKLFTTC